MRSEMVVCWDGVGREVQKEGLEGLDLSRVLGARGLPAAEW